MDIIKQISFEINIPTSGFSGAIEKELPTEVRKAFAVAISSTNGDLLHYRGKVRLNLGNTNIINDGEDAKNYMDKFDFGNLDLNTTDRRLRFSYYDMPTPNTVFPSGGYTVKVVIHYKQ